MEQLIHQLSKIKLFKNLSKELIQEYILPYGKVTSYDTGNHVIEASSKVNNILIILSGRVNMIYQFMDGSWSLADTETASHILALDVIATKTKISPYFAIASEPTRIFSFPASLLLKPGQFPEEKRQDLINLLLVMLSHMHMQKEKRLMILSRSGLRDRIMIYLSLQAQMRKSLSFSIPFSREEMASYLCVNRSSLCHELSLMRKEGIIDFHKQDFSILKQDYLETIL